MSLNIKSFSLTTFLLFVAAISVWIAYFALSHQVADLKSKLRPLQVVSNSLIVDDPEQMAVIRNPGDSVIFDLGWQIYLPPLNRDETFVICMAHDPDCKPKFPSIDEENVNKFPIPSGTHEISFEAIDQKERPRDYELKFDGETLSEFQFHDRRMADWEVFFDSSTVQQPVDQPFVLTPTKFTKDFEVYIWIQKIKR